MQTIDLHDKLALFDDRWSPRIVAELNGQHLKFAKLEGPFVWHIHADQDEAFLVLQGHLTIETRDGPGAAERAHELRPGQLLVVPRGVDHRPVAHGEVHVLLFEPAGTRNTGQIDDERTVEDPTWL